MTWPAGVLAPGARVFGRYDLRREVGRGGMGVVWAAWDTELEREIALKFLPEAVAADPEALRDLKRETRFCLELQHEHIVRVYDLVQQAPLAAIAMELVEGASLAQRKALAPGGCLDVAELTPLAAQLGAALDYAHGRARVIHRDLKPGNLLLTRDGRLKVTDFGIARSLADTGTRLTRAAGPEARGTSGTLPYMSPQQLQGKTPAVADDIYALGATLYDLLTGKPPFFRGDIATQVLHEAPARPTLHRGETGATGAPIPPAWEETLLACLAKEPGDRPASAGEVVARLTGARPPDRSVSMISAASPADDPWRDAPTQVRAAVEERTSAPAKAAPPAPDARRASDAAERADVAEAKTTWAGPEAQAAPAESGSSARARSRRLGRPLSPLASTAIFVTLGLVLLGGFRWWWQDGTTPVPREEPPALPSPNALLLDPAEVSARFWVGPLADVPVMGGRAALDAVPPGEHDLAVQAAGYQPFTARVTLPFGEPYLVKLVPVFGTAVVVGRPGTQITARDATGKPVVVTTIPDGGERLLEDELLIGTYTLRLEHALCDPVEVTGVQLAVGRTVRVAPVQTPRPGELRLFTTPAGADVVVDGQAWGTTPATLRGLPSERSLDVEVRLRGYRALRQEVTLRPTEARVLNLGTLVPETGAVRLSFAEGRWRVPLGELQVTVDGRSVTVAAEGRVAGLEPGTREIGVSHPDLEPWRGQVQVRDGEETPLALELTPKVGKIEVAANPPGSRIYVWVGDAVERGRAQGAAASAHAAVALNTLQRQLPAGPALVRVEAPGHRPFEQGVTLAPNRVTELTVQLERHEAPRAGGPWENTLGMKFVPVPGTEVLFCIWETRERDYEAFTRAIEQEWPITRAGPSHPIANINWNQAEAFCRWLTEKERSEGVLGPQQSYRLPLLAEWGEAIRVAPRSGAEAGSEGYPWGPAWPPSPGAGNFGDASARREAGLTTFIEGYDDGFASRAPVGSFAADRHGLHDLSGNVWEVCQDDFAGQPGRYGWRGGAHDSGDPRLLKPNASLVYSAETRVRTGGFRVVVTVGNEAGGATE